MTPTTRSTRLTILLFVAVLSLFGAACSSSSGDDTAVAVPLEEAGATTEDETSEPASSDEGEAAATSNGDFNCDDFIEPSGVIRGAAGWVPQIVDEETLDLIAGDLDAVDAAIEALRPIQDIDGIFGPMRPGLDNLATDVQAIRDGDYETKVGDYNVAGMNAVIGEKICG